VTTQGQPPPPIDPNIALEAGKLGVDLLWRKYELWVTLYRDYLALVLRVNLFFYAITGAIVSYYLAHQGQPEARYGLLLPFLMSAAFFAFFVYCAQLVPHMRASVFAIRDQLGLGTAVEVRVLAVLLYIFAAIFLVVMIALGWLMLHCPQCP